MITLTFQFETVDAAQDFLRAVNGPKTEGPTDTDLIRAAKEEAGRKERKPRSDAGQPRGPYKRKEETPAEAAAPATQTPVETPPTAPVAAAAVPAKDKQSLPSALTLADVRAAMTGRSTDKNIALLKKFGYEKSSELPPTVYVDFIAACKRGE